MPTIGTTRQVCADRDALSDKRHRSEKTLLHQLVSKQYLVFSRMLAEQGRGADYVRRQFEDYLKCSRL